MSELLELHRASAGSGKTYTLAKKFLWYFLTVKEESGPRRLRTFAEIKDSLSHILAVTFTNKATNEMQQRIVERLNDLAYPKAYPPAEGSPDYMEEFCRKLKVSPETLSRLCRKALAVVLENYSEFQVSTIDSFFQLVLRTFAYETDLNDSYAIELDSDYLARVGIDSILEDIEEGRATEEVKFWINQLMQRSRMNGKKWNIFQKREGNGSPYVGLLNAIGRLENENFKQIRDELEEYFENHPYLPELYDELEKKYGSLTAAPFEEMESEAKKLIDAIGSYSDTSIDNYRKHAQKCLQCRHDHKPSGSTQLFVPVTSSKRDGKTYQSRRKEAPELYAKVESIYDSMILSRVEWLNVFETPQYRHWALYRANFPYLGLLSISLRKRQEFLEDNNSVELAETNTLLSKIIGEDDAPFIYERLGTRLNHFLIDEFQDTSRMQWNNLRPLLSESISRGNENLLIGDAKQSIYRFRNADPSLISSKVEEEFGKVRILGNTPGENTNWRSDRTIVEFNNEFFSFLIDNIAETLDFESASKEIDRMDFRSLYSNVVQTPKNRKGNGYVEINMVEGSSSDDRTLLCAEAAVDLISDFISRGYRMKDIAFLVDTNDQAEILIEEFSRRNLLAGPDGMKIEFVSEQSLKVASAASVKLILNTLETIGRGADPEIREGEEGKRKGVADWDEIRSNYQVFAMRHPELSSPECIDAFLSTGADTDAIAEMLDDMQAVTLPALVEAITATFIKEDMRRRDAPFIAAFQDLVLEYCESKPSDIASFMIWWNHRGSKFAISSPEGMDAVTVMTIHKAKGLEFPCVVLPFAQYNFLVAPKKKVEWRWIRPEILEVPGMEMPPYMPVNTESAMIGTTHEHIYDEYIDMVTMDNLNKLYVGFTRAVNELYVFCGVKEKGKKKGTEKILSTSEMIRGYFGEEDSESEQLSVGTPYATSPVNTENENNSGMVIEDYLARITPDFLKYREESLPEIKDAETIEEELDEEDTDPRSEGNILHAIMERIIKVDDIHSAVRSAVIKGLLPRERIEEIESFLKAKLSIPEVAGNRWYSGEGKVINERTILTGGEKNKRPDRIIEMPDGGAVVIDYKFGKSQNMKKHQYYCRQVRRYADKLKSTGRYRYVKGYLWYVKEDNVIGL